MTYKLIAKVTISILTEVEADSFADAMKLVEDRSIIQEMWGQPALKESYWVAGEEYDGEPFDIKLND